MLRQLTISAVALLAVVGTASAAANHDAPSATHRNAPTATADDTPSTDCTIAIRCPDLVISATGSTVTVRNNALAGSPRTQSFYVVVTAGWRGDACNFAVAQQVLQISGLVGGESVTRRIPVSDTGRGAFADTMNTVRERAEMNNMTSVPASPTPC